MSSEPTPTPPLSSSSPRGNGLPVSCQCGHIVFTTPLAPTPPGSPGMSFCHCASCRKESGSAFGTSVYFPTEKVFPLPADLEAKLAMFEHPTGSGGTMRCFFCPRCGVRIFNAALLPDGVTMTPMVAFKGGVIDEGLDWKGKGKEVRHIFTREAVIKLEEGWECYETMPGGPKDTVRKE